MGPLLPNPGGTSGISRWDMDPHAYASDKKASWETSDFDSLFDRRTVETTPDSAARADVEKNVSTSTIGEEAPGVGGAEEHRFSAVSDLFGSDEGAVMYPSTAEVSDAVDLRDGAGLESAQSGIVTPVLLSSSDAMQADDSAGARAAALPPSWFAADDIAEHSNRVTVATDGTIAHVWIRDAAIPATANPDIGASLRVKLSWLGVALTSLKINGRSVLHSVGERTAEQSVMMNEGGRQLDLRVLKENGYGG